MAQVSKSIATLRIAGDDLDPEGISLALGAKPTFSVPRHGFHNYPSGRGRIARTGAWRIGTDYARPADLDSQIRDILSRLSNDPGVWKMISNRYEIDAFCGLWLEEENEMLGVMPSTLRMLGERNIKLELDIYFIRAAAPPEAE